MERRIQKIQKEEAEKKKLAKAVKKNTPVQTSVSPGFNRSSKSSSGDNFLNSLPKPTVFTERPGNYHFNLQTSRVNSKGHLIGRYFLCNFSRKNLVRTLLHVLQIVATCCTTEVDLVLLYVSTCCRNLSPVHVVPKKFENGVFTLKTHQMFSVHTTPEKLDLCLKSSGRQRNHMIIALSLETMILVVIV